VALIGLAGLARVSPAAVDAPGVTHAVVPTGPIDVNAASEAELATLPRIGPTLAARIVADRAVHGRYATLDDLDRVPGLGPSTVAGLRPHAIAGPPRTE
jgi:competence protein ComEA